MPNLPKDTGFGVRPPRIANPLIYPRRIFISVLRQFFSQDTLISLDGAEAPNPYKIFFRQDGSQDFGKSTLIISDAYDTSSSKHPQIIISRGSTSWRGLAIGNKDHGGALGTGQHDSNYADSLIVPVSISVHAAKDIEAENLLWLAAFFMQIFDKEIRTGSGIQHMTPFSIDPVMPAEQSDEYTRFTGTCSTMVSMDLRWRKTTTITIEDIYNTACPLPSEFDGYTDVSDVHINAIISPEYTDPK